VDLCGADDIPLLAVNIFFDLDDPAESTNFRVNRPNNAVEWGCATTNVSTDPRLEHDAIRISDLDDHVASADRVYAGLSDQQEI
jgi:hypothetical protein